MEWYEITVYTTHFGAELVADIFLENGGNGVAIFDNYDIAQLLKEKSNWDYVNEELLSNSYVVLVKGFVPATLIDQKMKLISYSLYKLKFSSDFDLGSLEVVKRKIDDEDWINSWKKHYKDIKIGNVVICPAWIFYEAKDNEVKVLIDPGLAFGTGEHETTAMCVELMQQYEIKDKAVLDIGCGSGILGITALKLNAKSCEFFDLDPIAVDACRRNLNLNDLEAKVFYNDLFHNAESKGDILLINIVADVLIGFSKSIKNHLNNGGVIILSGIIKERKDDVISAYKEQGFKLDSTITKGEWVALSFRNL